MTPSLKCSQVNVEGNGDKEGPVKLECETQDGTEKQPHKPTAYNAWMQAKLEELKEAAADPEQKHAETFKHAADLWATLPTEEKDPRVSGAGPNPPSHDAKSGARPSSSANPQPEEPEDKEDVECKNPTPWGTCCGDCRPCNPPAEMQPERDRP